MCGTGLVVQKHGRKSRRKVCYRFGNCIVGAERHILVLARRLNCSLYLDPTYLLITSLLHMS